MKKEILIACSVLLLGSSAYASVAPAPKGMHSSWDVDKDGVNDCEKDGTCDDSVDYSLPRGTDVVSYRDNFYRAVNRKWLASHEPKPETGIVSGMDIMTENTELQLKNILERLNKAESLSTDEQKIIDIYNSYLNVEQRNKIGISPMAEDLKMIQSAKTHEDIAKLFPTLTRLGVDTAIAIVAIPGKIDSTKYIVLTIQDGLALSKDIYLSKDKRKLELLQIYRNYLTQILSLSKLENVEKKVDDILKLESKLAAIQLDRVELRNQRTVYKDANFKEVDALLSHLNLSQSLKILGIEKTMPFDISHEAYMKAFNELFVSIDVNTWKSYLESQYIKTYGSKTITAFSDADFEYTKSLGLASKRSPMWKEGLAYVNSMAGMLLGKVYIEEYFSPKTKEKSKEIVENIIAEYKKKISSSTLFSKKTKERAMKKIENMKFNIGYPDKWESYDTLKIDKTDFFGNFKRHKAYEYAQNMSHLDKPVDKTKWEMSPQTLNAYYSPTKNKFILLSAILQKPVFDINASDAKNYGGIGMVIAHEIGHGFDDQGSRYDYQGNVVDWWEKEDRVKYVERAKRLISQADHFEYLPGQHLNGKLEIGEIIGDLNGVTLALSAYEKIIKENGLDRKASLKAFFISLAKVWRKKTEPHQLEQTIRTDNHPVSEFRVNGILKNIDTFHEIFETKKGDGMYMEPSKRVKLW